MEQIVLLLICLFAACVFEFINGFHDTANAVATVIYSKSLKPWQAVILSGFMNSIGVLAGGVGVAMGITNLIPMDILIGSGTELGVILVISLLISAIVWNFSTWYFGIPCSSSHTLVGSILGAGIAFSYTQGQGYQGVNWSKAGDIGMSLLISPFLGFCLAIMCYFILRKIIKDNTIFKAPKEKSSPPLWIRILLILTCSSVSYSHGSNDGQKGIGLIMIFLIILLPASTALNPNTLPQNLLESTKKIESILLKQENIDGEKSENPHREKILKSITSINTRIDSVKELKQLKTAQLFIIRKEIQSIVKHSKFLTEDKVIEKEEYNKEYTKNISYLKSNIEYVPNWVIILVSLCLGIGTMIGWKRIVVTIGEKIGKQNLTYAQGASAELVAAATISLASNFSLPVSTTQVLSSGIMGTMVASKGVKNLRTKTIKNIFLTWVLTLPVTIILSAVLFIILKNIFL